MVMNLRNCTKKSIKLKKKIQYLSCQCDYNILEAVTIDDRVI